MLGAAEGAVPIGIGSVNSCEGGRCSFVVFSGHQQRPLGSAHLVRCRSPVVQVSVLELLGDVMYDIIY
jgi:hypothetical protein